MSKVKKYFREFFEMLSYVFNNPDRILDDLYDLGSNGYAFHFHILASKLAFHKFVIYPVIVLGALFNTILAEYYYFTEAEYVRLLFVLLLLPAGALGGAVVSFIIWWLIHKIVVFLYYFVKVVGIAAIIIGVVGGVIWILYSIIVWTNAQ